MKFKGLSKIAIAGAALAATAATLGTSTYAWYVSNDKVTMDGVSGATAGTEVGANLVISGNKVLAGAQQSDPTSDSPASWGPTLSLTQAQDRAAYNQANSNSLYLAEALNPQSMEIGAESETWKKDDGTTLTSTSFIEFKVWIKNSKAAAIKPEFGIENVTTAANLKSQTAYNPNGLPNGVNSNDTFTVDAVNALRMEITKESDATYSGQGVDLSYTGDTVTKEIFKVAEMGKTADLSAGYTATPDASRFVYGGDANQYYKNMKGVAAYNTASDGTSKDAAENGKVYADEKAAWANFNVAADEAVKLTFRIWLEGADKDCWDSCIAQTFEFNLKFTALES